jgi:hypothetical protein
MGIQKTKIHWDVDTRWNITYRLLRKTSHLRPALERHLSSTQQGQELLLTQNEWRTLKLMVPFLEFFYTATVSLFASYTPTSIALLEELVTISDWYQCQLTELTEEDILWYSLEPMKVKFLKYWREISPITIVGHGSGKTRLARLRHIDTTRLVTVLIRHNTNKARHARHSVPPSIIFGHSTARHENKIK